MADEVVSSDYNFRTTQLHSEESFTATAASTGSPDVVEPKSAFEVDLRLLEYISDFDRNLMCPICRCPFIEPVRLGCDHTYCRLCLTRTLHNQSNDRKTCPTCRKPTSTSDALPIPRFLRHMVDDLVVKCPNSTAGCDKRLKRSDVQSHSDFYCPYTQVSCPDKDCSRKTPRKRATGRCLHQNVICEHCIMQMPELDLEDHLEQLCSVKTTSCSFCERAITRLELKRHEEECPQATQACPAGSIGCKYTSKKEDMYNHTQSCPLVAILPTITAATQKLNDQEAALKTLRRENHALEDTVAAMENLLAHPSAATMGYSSSSAQQSTNQKPLDTADVSDAPPFDSATHHMLSLHEALREELDRVSAAVSEVDGRASMTIINETLRIREELTHTNAVISSMRMQLQWLMSARLQAQPRNHMGAAGVSTIGGRGPTSPSAESGPSQPTRRLSDSGRQDTKL